MSKITIYSDGACSGNPGKGGWGAVIVSDGELVSEQYQGYTRTTNNRMELLGAIIPMENLSVTEGAKDLTIYIYSDSRYLCDAINKNWTKGWVRNGWKTSQKTPVKNKDLWIRLLEVKEKFREVRIIWIKGHNGHSMNEKADLLARTGISSSSLLVDEGFLG